ncbi:uncharacterized protein LOC132159037 isoform X2 [Carassius carassius]|uniref:uncharacterized protein LOC132159037 isoform X2 n=1 Tax=Carassius carassius TaxID=217509 RepID=UPI00286904A8|nr:uncharacterized protein LOC132159037 isoform X2 [Carassius carassius]
MIFFLLFTLIFFIFSGVFGAADTDEIQSISVMRGDSLTLHTDVTEVQRDDLILWTFGSKDNLIAEIHKQVVYMFDSKGHFKLEEKTGSLTIRNIRTENCGLYELTVINLGRTSYKRFNVTVIDTLEKNVAYLPVPVISRDPLQCSSSSSPNCSLVCSVVNVEYQDKNSYSCVINNPISNQTQHLDISKLCHSCSDLFTCCGSTEAVIRLVISALVGVATVTAVIYDIRS